MMTLPFFAYFGHGNILHLQVVLLVKYCCFSTFSWFRNEVCFVSGKLEFLAVSIIDEGLHVGVQYPILRGET